MKRVELRDWRRRGGRRGDEKDEEEEEEEESVNHLKSHRRFEMHHCRTAWS